MTEQEILNEVAKIDGWQKLTAENDPFWIMWQKDNKPSSRISTEELPNYLTNGDEIRRVIAEQSDVVQDIIASYLFVLLALDLRQPTAKPSEIIACIIKAIPRQLCEALLRALGKWKI